MSDQYRKTVNWEQIARQALAACESMYMFWNQGFGNEFDGVEKYSKAVLEYKLKCKDHHEFEGFFENIPFIENTTKECPMKDEEVSVWEIKYIFGSSGVYSFKPSEALGWSEGMITHYRVLEWKKGFGPDVKI